MYYKKWHVFTLSMIWHWVNDFILIREMVCYFIFSSQKLKWERMRAELGKSSQALYNSNEIVSLLKWCLSGISNEGLFFKFQLSSYIVLIKRNILHEVQCSQTCWIVMLMKFKYFWWWRTCRRLLILIKVSQRAMT